jgi:hypothetical protein
MSERVPAAETGALSATARPDPVLQCQPSHSAERHRQTVASCQRTLHANSLPVHLTSVSSATRYRPPSVTTPHGNRTELLLLATATAATAAKLCAPVALSSCRRLREGGDPIRCTSKSPVRAVWLTGRSSSRHIAPSPAKQVTNHHYANGRLRCNKSVAMVGKQKACLNHDICCISSRLQVESKWMMF